jgi:prophage antirepressor-like protein
MNALVNLNECPDYVTFEVDGRQNHVRIVGTNEEPWFCGKDLCVVLEYEHQKKALQTNVDEDCKKSLSLLSSEVGNLKFPTILGRSNLENVSYNEGKTVYINEAGLYSLIMGSRAPVAKQFRSLVCKEILPAIRKYGTYSINKQLETATKQLEQLSLENKAKDDQIAKQSEKLVTAERKALRINKFMRRIDTKDRKDEWIYIATSQQYAANRVFKIGSTERLIKRIGPYNCGRLSSDQIYYAWAKPCYKSKDVDQHIQKLLSSFKDKEKSEMYVGISFTILCEILTVIIDNYDKSQEYVYDFIKNRLEKSAEEDDGEPPEPLDLKSITYHFGEHSETVNLTHASDQEVKDELILIINRLKKDGEPLEFTRKELVEELQKKYQGDQRSIWATMKRVAVWKSSKNKVRLSDDVKDCKIVY